MDYDNKGTVALWKNDKKGNDKAPAAKGHVYAHRDIRSGEKIELALWRNDNSNPNAPMMTGKLSDPREPVNQEAKEAFDKEFEDDSFPF